jgi:hypothetical protein
VKFPLSILFLLILSPYARAQERLKADVSWFPQSAFKDTSGQLSLQRFGLGSSFKLWAKQETTADEVKFHKLSLPVRLSYNRVRCSLLPDQPDILSISSGLSYLSFNGPRNVWLFSASPIVAAPLNSFSNLRYRLMSFAIFQRRVDEYWTYRLGAVYIQANRSLLLPFVGFDYHFDKTHKLQFNLPFNLAYVAGKPASEWKAGLGFNGFYSQLNDSSGNGYLRLQQLVLDLRYKKKLSSHLSLAVSAGITGGRKFYLREEGNTVRADLEPGLLFKLEAAYRFSKKKKEALPEVPDIDLLNLDDFNLDDLDEEDLEEAQ